MTVRNDQDTDRQVDVNWGCSFEEFHRCEPRSNRFKSQLQPLVLLIGISTFWTNMIESTLFEFFVRCESAYLLFCIKSCQCLRSINQTKMNEVSCRRKTKIMWGIASTQLKYVPCSQFSLVNSLTRREPHFFHGLARIFTLVLFATSLWCPLELLQ